MADLIVRISVTSVVWVQTAVADESETATREDNASEAASGLRMTTENPTIFWLSSLDLGHSEVDVPKK